MASSRQIGHYGRSQVTGPTATLINVTRHSVLTLVYVQRYNIAAESLICTYKTATVCNLNEFSSINYYAESWESRDASDSITNFSRVRILQCSQVSHCLWAIGHSHCSKLAHFWENQKNSLSYSGLWNFRWSRPNLENLQIFRNVTKIYFVSKKYFEFEIALWVGNQF